MKLFQYAVIFHPKKEIENKPADKAKLIVEPKTVLAADLNSATLLAARDIPQDYADKLDQCEVAVRPF